MSVSFGVDFDGVDAAVTRLAESRDRVRDALTILDGRVSRLRQQWTGEASDAYDRAHRDLVRGMDELNALLGLASSELGKANGEFRASEDRNAARWPG